MSTGLVTLLLSHENEQLLNTSGGSIQGRTKWSHLGQKCELESLELGFLRSTRLSGEDGVRRRSDRALAVGCLRTRAWDQVRT